MIKNIIFDIGDVLVYFRYREYMRELGFSGELVEFFADNMVMTPYWHEMDLGAVDDARACDHFVTVFPQYEREIRLFWSGISGIIEEYDYANPLVSSLKEAGYKVYALSNYPDKLSDLHWPTFTFLPKLDGYIISAKEKLAKPDPAIYKLMLSRYKLTAEESIFADDRENNVEAACALGFCGIHFTGYKAFVNALREHGVTLP